MTPYQLALAKNMGDAILKARKSGATALSMENLVRITKMPSNFLEGSPKGWKAFYECLDEVMQAVENGENSPELKVLAEQFT